MIYQNEALTMKYNVAHILVSTIIMSSQNDTIKQQSKIGLQTKSYSADLWCKTIWNGIGQMQNEISFLEISKSK